MNASMAATIAKATGYDKSRVKETHRLGSESSDVEAATWRTFASADIRRDGSGYLRLTRDGVTLLTIDYPAESVGNVTTAQELARELRRAASRILAAHGLDVVTGE